MHAREANLLRSLIETTWRFYVWLGFLAVVLVVGVYAYIHQLREGLVVTGLRDQVSWGLYISNFVFFIGISHAGTLISAILRVTQTEWRRPITRMAEGITVLALCIGAPMVIVDLGRPDRIFYLLRYPRIQSPIIWDVLSVSTYLAGCLLYFYIPMIPDLAVLAVQPGLSRWRRALYRRLALGWTGSEVQRMLLDRAITCMAVVIIPLAVSVHTVVSWIFAMTLRPGWDSSIFGPYFVIGAIYSGAAAVIFSMYVLRRIFCLEDYIELLHFRNLGLLLLSFALLYLYFNINEYLTVGYKLEGIERDLIHSLFVGNYARAFWSVQTVGVFIPILLMITVLGWMRYREFTIPGVALSSALVIIGAWAKRYLIVIPTLQTPFLPAQRLPWEWTHYRPTWVEWSIIAAAFAGFLMIYTLLVKIFPVVSIWETREVAKPAAEPERDTGRWWKPGKATLSVLLLVFVIVVGSTRAIAAAPRPAKPTTLTVEWKTVSRVEPSSGGKEEALEPSKRRAFWYTDRPANPFRLWRQTREEEYEEYKTPTVLLVSAVLGERTGTPISFKAVSFSLRTNFGTLPLGSRPTTEEGRAELAIRDQRFGTYVLIANFGGDDEYEPTQVEIPIDFGPKPAPALPVAGVLITPYATPAIGIPFLVFYGTMWVVFLYAFGYLILYRLRRYD